MSSTIAKLGATLLYLVALVVVGIATCAGVSWATRKFGLWFLIPALLLILAAIGTAFYLSLG